MIDLIISFLVDFEEEFFLLFLEVFHLVELVYHRLHFRKRDLQITKKQLIFTSELANELKAI